MKENKAVNSDVLYSLDNLPSPLEEQHHALIAMDVDTHEYHLLTKHYVIHQLKHGVMHAYVGWADATDEASMT